MNNQFELQPIFASIDENGVTTAFEIRKSNLCLQLQDSSKIYLNVVRE